jgi:hypothetical protein
VAAGPKTLLKVKDLLPSFPYFVGVVIVMVLSSIPATLVEEFACPGRKGLTRQYTLIFPGYKKNSDVD